MAAEKEYQAIQLAYKNAVSVPEPISQNRHVLVMGIIAGAQLSKYTNVGNPKTLLREILRNVRKTFLKAHLIHGDLSEYNIILQPDGNLLIIDWPQAVKTDHPNAKELLERDIKNVLIFFSRKFNIELTLKEAYEYVVGEARSLKF